MPYQEVSKCVAIDNTPGSICQLKHAPYRYIPTLWVGVVFSILYAGAFLAHLILAIWPGRFRRGGFMLLACVCAGGEMAGWASRTTSHYDFFSRTPYLVQLICLIISPIFISAANYVALERITLAVGTELARLGTKTYFAIFVSGDILSLIVQAAGGGISATSGTDKGVRQGSNIALAGVIIQVLVTGPFLMLFCDFHYRHYRAWKEGMNHDRWTKGTIRVSCATFVSTIFILIRCIYRCAEMKEGWVGHLSTTEVWFCIFDGCMIAVAVWVFLIAHPGFCLPLPWSVRGQYVPMDTKARVPTSTKRRSHAYSGVPYDDFPVYETTYATAAESFRGGSDKGSYPYAERKPKSKPSRSTARSYDRHKSHTYAQADRYESDRYSAYPDPYDRRDNGYGHDRAGAGTTAASPVYDDYGADPYYDYYDSMDHVSYRPTPGRRTARSQRPTYYDEYIYS